MKTIKQIADELGVSKQAVRKQVDKLPPTLVSTGSNNAILINDDGIRIIREKVSTKNTKVDTNQVSTVDTLVDMLQKELEIKNDQIRELNTRLAESNAALLIAQQSAQTAQALHAGTIKKQLTGMTLEYTEEQPTADEEPQTLSFIDRLKQLFK